MNLKLIYGKLNPYWVGRSAGPSPANRIIKISFKNQSLTFLTSVEFWRNSLAAAQNFWRRCIWAALGLALSNIIAIGTLNYFDHQLQQLQNTEVVYGLDKLIQIAGVVLVGLIAGLIIGFWALYKWLFLLTAFARVLQVSGWSYSDSDVDAALNEIKAKRGYLAQVWLFASAFLLLPVVPLSVAIALGFVIRKPQYMQSVQLPEWASPAAIGIGAITAVISFAYSLVTIVWSSKFETSAAKTAWNALRECFSNCLPITVITVVVLFLNLVISAPYMLLFFTGWQQMIESNIFLGVITQIWFGASSAVLWPLSVAPYCRFEGNKS